MSRLSDIGAENIKVEPKSKHNGNSVSQRTFQGQARKLYESIETPSTVEELSHNTGISHEKVNKLVSELERLGVVTKADPTRLSSKIRKLFKDDTIPYINRIYVYRTQDQQQIDTLIGILIKMLPPVDYLEKGTKHSLISAVGHLPTEISQTFRDNIIHFPTKRESEELAIKKPYRKSIDIAAEIINVARTRVGIYKLSDGAEVSYSVLVKNYLPKLIKAGALAEQNVNGRRLFETTEKGLEFLKLYSELMDKASKIFGFYESTQKTYYDRHQFSRSVFSYIKTGRQIETDFGIPVIRFRTIW